MRIAMKKLSLALIALFAVSTAYGQSHAQALSPAQQRIAWAEKAIEKNPGRIQSYNDLALALARRARETSDPAYYTRAQVALAQSTRLAPDNFEAQRLRVWILLGQHEFAEALEGAKALNRRMPDDLLAYGFLVDAHVELGNYKEAEDAAQWMLDIRPGTVPGLTRAGYLRELFGDIDGAIELMDAAFQRTPPNEVEERAWILTQIGHLRLMTGKTDTAEKLLGRALDLFPGYHYALANLAKVRAAQEKYAEAVELLRRRWEAAPHPENLYDLAEAVDRAGRPKEAEALYAEFDRKARAEMDGNDNANRELIFFYADRARRPAEALRIAQREIGRRHDVYTRDAYAWALYVNGRYAEAWTQIGSALEVGIRDAKFLYHAGAIAAKLGNQSAAAGHFQQSLALNPVSEVATVVRAELGRRGR